MHKKVPWMKNRITELADIEARVNEHPNKQLSLTDPDSRLMKTSNMVQQICYNVQSAVDSQHHLIISHEVTQSTDRRKLHLVATQVQEAFGTTNITFVADKGYYNRADIKNVLDTGSEMLVPKGDTSGAAKAGIFNKNQFKYNRVKDGYICPAGNILPYRRNAMEDALQIRIYVDHIACRYCDIHAECTHSKSQEKYDVWYMKMTLMPCTNDSRKRVTRRLFVSKL